MHIQILKLLYGLYSLILYKDFCISNNIKTLLEATAYQY